MTTSSEPFTTDQTHAARLGFVLSAFALLLPLIGLLADKAVVPLAAAAALAGGLAVGRAALSWRIIDRPLGVVMGLFLAWCLVSALWSGDPAAAAKLALRVGFLLYVLLYLAGLTRFLDAARRKQVARCLAIGFAVTLAVLLVELAFRTPLFDLLQGEARTDYAAYSRLNRGVSTLAILVWPLALIVWQQGLRWLALLLPAAMLTVTLFSQSSASALALGAGLLAAALAGFGRGLARLVMVAAVTGAVLANPVIIEGLQRAGLGQSGWLSDTGQFRLHIWNVINERIAEKPLFGWGFDASPALPTGGAQPFRPDRKVIPSHPHNGGLQIMVELGLVGSLLAAAFLFLTGRRIDRLSPAARSSAVGMLVTILGIACTAYSIWQSHWLSVIGAAAVLFTAVQQREGDKPPRL